MSYLPFPAAGVGASSIHSFRSMHATRAVWAWSRSSKCVGSIMVGSSRLVPGLAGLAGDEMIMTERSAPHIGRNTHRGVVFA